MSFILCSGTCTSTKGFYLVQHTKDECLGEFSWERYDLLSVFTQMHVLGIGCLTGKSINSCNCQNELFH